MVKINVTNRLKRFTAKGKTLHPFGEEHLSPLETDWIARREREGVLIIAQNLFLKGETNMKKIVALVLALMMVLSLGVSALALTKIELNKVEKTDDGKKLIKFENTVDILGDPAADKVLYTDGAKGGVAYFVLNTTGLKDVKATYSNDTVKAEVMDYNPETMEWVDGVAYQVVRKDGKAIDEWLNKIPAYDKDTQPDGLDWNKCVPEGGKDQYDWCAYAAKTLNKYFKTTQFYVKTTSEIKILKLTVAANYSASFTEGSVKVSALRVEDKKTVYTEMKIVNDITIFAYEYVKSAAEYKYALELFDTGYSDYKTYVNGYKQADLAQIMGSRVISTTAFRAIEGKNITVNVYPSAKENDNRVAKSADVTIYNVAAGQKGVNFEYYEKEVKEANKTALAVDGENRKVEFGFYGDQVVKSKFTVNFDLDWTYFQLREFFGKKIEEQDVVTYYIIKDGKVLKEVKVDYMTVDYNDTVKLSIDGENTTLGQYQIAVKVPAENKGEKNPNTGAESVMGVVAAVAVVSVAAAAAVSLKK